MKCNKGTGTFAQAVKMNIQGVEQKRKMAQITCNRAVSSTLRLKPTYTSY